MGEQIVSLGAERFRRLDPAAAARQRFAAALTATGIARTDLASMLTERLGWPVSVDILGSWERTITPPADALLVVESLRAIRPTCPTIAVRSHKLVCGFVGSYEIGRLVDVLGAQLTEPQTPSEHWTASVHHPGATATFHLWGHGATVAHLIQDVQWPDLTSLARWRYTSYEDDMTWAARVLGTTPAQPYVMSVYWVHDLPWSGQELRTALQLLCSPRVLVGETPDVEPSPDLEANLIRDGFHHPGLVEFSSGDAAIGYASWSGIVYAPMDPTRALTETHFMNIELPTQSLWQYAYAILSAAEDGKDPDLPAQYGWRWLRGAGSTLLTPRAQEPAPHRVMREAIVTTSSLPDMLTSSITTLRES